MAVIAKFMLLCLTVGFTSAQYANFTGGEPLPTPTQLVSAGGQLDVTLSVDASDLTVDWFTAVRRMYNGSTPGPTIRVKAGDRLFLKLINDLQEPDFFQNETVCRKALHSPNTTNLHVHGLHVSPKEPQDNIFHTIRATQQYQYDYSIGANHPAGTYWYHPHNHGSAAFQIESGMVGMIVVEDPAGSAMHDYEEVEILLQLYRYLEAGGFTAMQISMNDYFRLDSALETHLTSVAANIDYMIVNGKLWPNMTLDAGVYKRFRIVNTNQLYSMGIYFEDTVGNATCDVQEIAVDGVYLNTPRTPFQGKSFITSGGRMDLLVKCDTPSQYEMRSIRTAADSTSFGFFPMIFNGLLMSISVESTATTTPTALPSSLPSKPAFLNDLQSITEDQIGGRFVVEITPTTTLNREDFEERGANYYRYKMEVGTIQELIFTNPEAALSHPMHMHVNHMQVISYNEYTGPVAIDEGRFGDWCDPDWTMFNQTGAKCLYQHERYNASATIAFTPGLSTTFIGHESAAKRALTIGYHTVGDWIDTLQVPPLANITVRFRAADYTGPVAIHCHTTMHEDRGTMMVVEIVDVGANLTANVMSNGTYPWACMTNEPNSLPIVRTSGAGLSAVPTSLFAMIGSLILGLVFASKSM